MAFLWVHTQVYQGYVLLKHASNISDPSASLFLLLLFFLSYHYTDLLCIRYLLLLGHIFWQVQQTSKKNLEREDICKTVPFKVVDCRLIGLGDQKSNIETLKWKTKLLCIKWLSFCVAKTKYYEFAGSCYYGCIWALATRIWIILFAFKINHLKSHNKLSATKKLFHEKQQVQRSHKQGNGDLAM